MPELKDRWVCYSILHDGEGERGRKVVVHGIVPMTADEAAEIAAAQLHDREARQEGYDCHACAFGDTSQAIEVETTEGPKRFRVYTRAKMEYRAEPDASAKKG